ncbi:hypothetical protein GF415_04945 [Candidatus Micrarchaeota archaeon]|nr:hypothetical protein [Candidatus Micrarchaeota archaeon]
MHFQSTARIRTREAGRPARQKKEFRKMGLLREELMQFAGGVKPGLGNGNGQYHLMLSKMLGKMDSSGIRKFRQRIKRGKEDGLFPAEKIICSEGEAASRLAEFLGKEYVGRMIFLARCRGDMRQVELGKKYLSWAAKNGRGPVRERALAGMVMVASDEIEEKKGAYLGEQRARRNGTMKLLKKEIGEEKAEQLVDKFIRGIRGSLRGMCLSWMLLGAAAASSMPAFQGYFSGQKSNAALLVLGASALVGVAKGLELLDSINIKRIQGKISQ